MNNISRLITGIGLFFAVGFLSSCVKENYKAPEQNIPDAGLQANYTIAELYQYYADSIPSGLGIINQDIIIKGVVVGTDESGNIYKTIYIEDLTAGLQISLDMTDIYTSYRLGQTVYIKCQGLYLGSYNGVMQLGFLYGSGIGRIPAALISDHFFLDGLPYDAPVPSLLTIAALTGSQTSMLIKIDSVSFVDVGRVFANQYYTTDRLVSDKNGLQLDIRTSNYANFAGKTIPDGVGCVVGILGSYNSDGYFEFYIRDLNDLIGFSTSITEVLFEESFSGSIGNFTTYSVTGSSQVWTHDGTYSCMKMSGYSGGNIPNEDWLISPSFDMSQNDSIYLTFDQAIKYATAINIPLNHTVWVSTNYTGGDPSTATWIQLSIPTYPPGSDWTFVNSGKVNFATTCGGQPNVHFAFKYISTSAEASTWEIKNIKLKGTPL